MIVILSYAVYDIGEACYEYYKIKKITDFTAFKIKIETPVAKVDVDADNSIEWAFIGKILALVLVAYGGIKIINKKIK